VISHAVLNQTLVLNGGTLSEGFDRGSISWGSPSFSGDSIARLDLQINDVRLDKCDSSGSVSIEVEINSFTGLVVSNGPLDVSCNGVGGDIDVNVNISGTNGTISSGSYIVSCREQGCSDTLEEFSVEEVRD
jgi:hypothetical protein